MGSDFIPIDSVCPIPTDGSQPNPRGGFQKVQGFQITMSHKYDPSDGVVHFVGKAFYHSDETNATNRSDMNGSDDGTGVPDFDLPEISKIGYMGFTIEWVNGALQMRNNSQPASAKHSLNDTQSFIMSTNSAEPPVFAIFCVYKEVGKQGTDGKMRYMSCSHWEDTSYALTLSEALKLAQDTPAAPGDKTKAKPSAKGKGKEKDKGKDKGKAKTKPKK